MRPTSFAGRNVFRSSAIVLPFLLATAIAFAPSPFFVLAASLAICLVTLFTIKPEWGVYALLIASVCTAISVEVGSLTIRPDQVITLLVVNLVFLFLTSGRRPFITTTLDWWVIAYLLVNVLSSLLHAPDLKTSLRKCLLLTVTFSAYFATTQLIVNRKILSRIISLLIMIGIFEAIYGIVSVYFFTSGINIGGAHAPYGDVYARGTFIEGNIFGSFQMIIALILTSFLFSAHFQHYKAPILMMLVLVLVSSIMSFTRAAWLGYIAGSFCYIFFIRKQLFYRVLKHLPVLLVALLLLGALGYILSVTVHSGSATLLDLYLERFRNIVNSHSSYSASARVLVWKKSIEFWQRNPILGNGTDSIKALAVGTTMPMFGTEYWIPNSMILALHDTGLVGLFLFLAIQFVFLWKLWVSMRRTSDPFLQVVMEGFFAAFIGVQIAYFFSNAFWLIFIWFFMAVGMACCRFAQNRAERNS